MDRRLTSASHRRIALVAALLLVAPLAACSADGGDDAGTTTTAAVTTTTGDDAGTTTTGADTTDTSEGTDGPDDVVLDDLLPTEDDLDGWTETERGPVPEKEEDDEDDPSTVAFAKQCPDLHEYLDSFDPDANDDLERVQAIFEQDGVQATFKVGEISPHFTPDNVEQIVDLQNDCSFAFEANGFDYEVSFLGKLDDTVGDLAYSTVVQFEATTRTGDVVAWNQYEYLLAVGDYTYGVVLEDGVTDDNEVLEADTTLLDEWVPLMERTLGYAAD